MNNRNIRITIVLAALLISSSLIVLADVPPLIWDLPLIGLVGYGLAFIMSLSLIISILFSK